MMSSKTGQIEARKRRDLISDTELLDTPQNVWFLGSCSTVTFDTEAE